MVYKGKPSEGCETCRKRRIKCDLQRPRCGQCYKSRRECLGWRDQIDLLFVNQTNAVEAKASSSRLKQSVSRIPRPNDADGNVIDISMLVIPKCIPETVERQALAFFFSEYMVMPRYADTTRGFLEYILPLCSTAAPDSPLFGATAAMALASLGVKRPNPQMRQKAKSHYGKAVARLQDDIGDPNLSRSDHTLMAIMVLGFYESLVADASSIADWGHHAEGARALAQHRGKDMLNSAASKKLYWAAQTQAVYSNIIKNTPMAPYLDWEQLWDDPLDLPPENNATQLTHITSRIPCLRAGAFQWLKRPMSGEVALKCVDLIGYARILDLLIAGWSFNVPPLWKPRIVGVVEGSLDNPETTELYPGRVEVYADLWAGNTVNAWRIMRSACNMIIVNCTERLYPPEQLHSVPEYDNAVKVIQEMADGVCASVPFSLGHSLPTYDDPVFEPSLFMWPTTPSTTSGSSPGSASLDSTSSHDMPKPSNPTVGSLGGHYLILPLFFMYPTPTLPDAQRRWMAGRLRFIGKEYGSGQAAALANICPPSNKYGRPTTNADFAPPPFVSFPDVYSIVRSDRYQDEQAMKELKSPTAEGNLFRAWRKDFLKRLLDL